MFSLLASLVAAFTPYRLVFLVAGLAGREERFIERQIAILRVNHG